MVVVYVNNNECGYNKWWRHANEKIRYFWLCMQKYVAFKFSVVMYLLSVFKKFSRYYIFFSEIIFHFILPCLTTIRLSFKATRRRTWSFVRSGRKMKIYFKTKNGNSFAVGSTQKTQWKKSQIKPKTKIELKVKFPMDHSFNMHANVCVSRGSKCQLFRKFCLRTKWMIPHATVKET